MNWSEAGEENRKALRRLLALLLALADLAERAGGRSRPVRLLVLWLLRPAEEIARDHVAGLTHTAFPPAPAISRDADGIADAMRLALSFRTLAAALAALTVDAFGSWRAGAQILRVLKSAAAPPRGSALCPSRPASRHRVPSLPRAPPRPPPPVRRSAPRNRPATACS